MKLIVLLRIEHGESETIGVLVIDEKIECLILEAPDLNNQKNISCIPVGIYDCEKYYSTKYGCECARLLNVPDRTYISIHYGNTAIDTDGCLLPGKHTGYLYGERAVVSSKSALKGILNKLPDTFRLEIKEV